ncbi:hypothetical protein C0Q70_17921 [Pomacea canaliculata]|uniref:Sulfhydryl oxidase n=1 Tax=Pomacea canaliculata TaxID=400727 RepID=A0A2T7NLR8_POMCA|nr:hypothetical protein C0Q70_17921 [Pomacea canaliculata]
MNVEICRDYNVQAYPSIKLFPPYTTKEQTDKHMIKNVNTQNAEELRDAVLDYITDPKLKPPNTWPRLQPLKSIADIWNEAQSEHKFVVLVFENEHSLVGRQVILDLVDYPTVLVRTMLKEDVEKFGIMIYPSLYSINKDSSFQLLASGTGQADSDRHRFVDTLLNLVGHINHEGKKLKIVHDEDKQVNDGVVHFLQEDNMAISLPQTSHLSVHMLDLESALHYSLRQEVAICKTIEGQKLDALRNFITTLAKFFPGRKEVVAFLWKLANHLAELKEPLTGESWLEAVESIQDKNAFLPKRVSWVECKGSQPGYRGYPCSMWTLFHVLTVSAYDNAKAVNPQEVLLSISGYMKHFFGCQECSQNFLKMAATIEDEVHKPRDAVIWLWNAHNRANKRLHGDVSEDPQHPKVQFPPASDCPECHMVITPDSDQSPKWNTSATFFFLVKFFSKDSIIQITSEEDTETPMASLIKKWKQYRNGLVGKKAKGCRFETN